MRIQLVQAASGGRARVLRVLRERNGSLYPVPLHLLEHRLREGLGVSESDVRFMRGRRRVHLVQKLAHCFSLNLCPFQNRRSPAYIGVLFLDLWRTSLSNPRSEDRLHRERDEIVVVKQAREEIVHLGDLSLANGLGITE